MNYTIVSLESERDLVEILAEKFEQDGFLGDFLKASFDANKLSVHLSTILSLPERLIKYGIDSERLLNGTFEDVLSSQFLGCFDCLPAKVMSLILERTCILGLHHRLIDIVMDSAPEGWTATISLLSLPRKYLILRDCILNVNERLLASEDLGVEPGFPLQLESSRDVSFAHMDILKLKLKRIIGCMFNDASFASYAINKICSDLVFCQETVALRYLIVSVLKDLDLLPLLFTRCFLIWSDKDFIAFNNLPYYHEYLSDLLLLSISWITGDRMEIVTMFDQLLPSRLEIMFNKASMLYLDYASADVKTRGLLVIETIANKLFTPGDFRLDFEINSDNIEKKWVNYLVEKVPFESFPRAEKSESMEEISELSKNEDWDSDDSDESLPAYDIDPESLGNVSAFPPPKLLKQCLEYLKHSDNDAENADKIEICLRHMPSLIYERFISIKNSIKKFNQRELRDVGPLLLSKLLHLHDAYNIPKFDMLRRNAIVALSLADFENLSIVLVKQFWTSQGLSWSQRAEILDIASEISILFLQDSFVNNVCELHNSVLYKLVDSPPSQAVNTKEIRSGKTRIIAPRSLELQRMRSSKPPKTLWKVMSLLFLPLSQGLWTTPLIWLQKEAGVYISLNSKQQRETLEISASVLILLSKWITTLTILLRLTGPNDPQIISYLNEMKHVAEWYWNWLHRSQIRVPNYDLTSPTGLSTIAKPEMSQLLNHPQVRTTILFMFCTLFELNENINSFEKFTSFPFGWFENLSFDLSKFIEWLMRDVAIVDRNPRNRKMASFILSSLQQRFETTLRKR